MTAEDHPRRPGSILTLIANLGAHGRALAALMSLAALVLALGYHFIVGRISQMEENLHEKGATIASQIAAEAEPALRKGDRAQIESLIHKALLYGDVIRVVVRDTEGNIHAEAATAEKDASEALLASVETVVHESVTEAGGNGIGRVLGTVEVDISREHALLHRQSASRTFLLLIIVTTLFGALLVLWAVRSQQRSAAGRVTEIGGDAIGKWSDGAAENTAWLRQTIDILEHRNLELEALCEKAFAAGEEKANFLASMSHEIRAPINAVLGHTAMLERSGLNAEQREHAHAINRASTQLLRVIDDILSFSRLESGVVQLDETDFDLYHDLEDALCMVAPEARSKQLELVLTIDPEVPTRLIGDPARLGQIVINLLNNAIKFTDQGSITVHVSLLQARDAQAELEIRITDTGIGIAPEALERIFASFHQADASISRRYGGTGLGLAIVSRLVQLWGGRVGVISQPGAGSTFWFTLICGVREGAATENPDPLLAGRKVLAYDDHSGALRALRNLLRSAGMEVCVAHERENIVDRLADARSADTPFDLIVLGLQIAESDDVLESLLDPIRREHGLPVLLMVNSDHTELFSRSLRDEAVKVVLKPLRRHVLFRHFSTLLGRPVREPEASASLGGESPSSFEGLRVLLAEDNEFNRELVAGYWKQPAFVSLRP